MPRTLTRQRFLGLLAAAAPAMALAACGESAATSAPVASPAPTAKAAAPAAATASNAQQPAPAATSAPAVAKGKQTIRYTMFGHPNLAEQIVAKFNETHPDVEVKFERSPGQDYEQKLQAALAGGNAWDAFRASGSFATHYGPEGAIIDVGPYESRDKAYPADLFLDGVLDAFTVGGKRYGMPAWCLTQWLFYNKKLFDEAGVAYPTPDTTWEQYAEMAQKLAKKDSSGQIAQYGANGWGGWTLPDADPKTVQVFQDEADLMNKYKVMPSPLNPPSSPVNLLTKKVATQIDGDWYPWDQRDQWSPDFDATLTPLRGGQRVNCYMPDALVINAKSQVKDAAYQWVSWWAADPASWAIQGAVVFPVTKRMYEDPKLRDTWLKAPARVPGIVKYALEHQQHHQVWTFGPRNAEFESKVLNPGLDNLWHAKSSAKDVLETITQQGNALLAQPAQ